LARKHERKREREEAERVENLRRQKRRIPIFELRRIRVSCSWWFLSGLKYPSE
jgi:hypothetical protein